MVEELNGFCMAIADSVPGVSGGTVAFIMGFYDKFIDSINDILFGNCGKRKIAFKYLLKIGLGWIMGMMLSVVVLSTLFEKNIYEISSLFIGFLMGAIPVIIMEEKKVLQINKKAIAFSILGAAVVIFSTWLNGKIGIARFNLSDLSLKSSIKLFIVGMIAISAMFLPGISGSTLLLIFGVYMPIITAVKNVLVLKFNYLPALIIFGLGLLAGSLSIVKIIKICLEKFRTQTIYLIIGMMIGSFYAIIMGPTTLEIPKLALNLNTFNMIFAFIGCSVVVGLKFYELKCRKS